MTIKTFKSAMTDDRELEVDVIFSKPRLLIKEFDGDNTGFVFAPSDAPALCLAILEEAGVSESSDAGVAVSYLRSHIAEQERSTAEARERAELEAEALELFNVNQVINLPDWGNADRAVISSWVRVARLAREINKKEGQ